MLVAYVIDLGDRLQYVQHRHLEATGVVESGAYDVYQHYSLLSDENRLANQLETLGKQIEDLSNQENACPDVNPEREQQIEELKEKAFNLTAQLAAAHASDVVKGLATTAVCVGLTAVAAGPLIPF